MYYIVFIHSSVTEHIVCFHVLAIGHGVHYLFELWFSQGICPGVELLGNSIVLSLASFKVLLYCPL